MKIGLNLLYIIPGQNGGTQTYAESLIKALAALGSDDEFTVFVSEEGAALSLPEQGNFHNVVCPVSSVRREVRYLWEQSIFPAFLRRSGVEILHSLGYVGPLFPHCPQVVTIHDVNFLAIPSTMSTVRQAVLNKMVPMVAHRCARVLTVSQFSKGQIHQYLRVPESQIIVTHEGPRTRTALSPRAWECITVQYGIEKPYIIAFDSLIGHKNIGRLLEAFSAIKNQVPH